VKLQHGNTFCTLDPSSNLPNSTFALVQIAVAMGFLLLLGVQNLLDKSTNQVNYSCQLQLSTTAVTYSCQLQLSTSKEASLTPQQAEVLACLNRKYFQCQWCLWSDFSHWERVPRHKLQVQCILHINL